MPIVTAYRNGSTAGTPPTKNDHVRAKRDVVQGWSPGAVRRHTKWLYGVDAEALPVDGLRGYAVTLTMRDCPPDADTFHALRRAWVKRMERRGMVRYHWVIEWQRRGVPHIHAAVYFPSDSVEIARGATINPGVLSCVEWVDVAGEYGASIAGQHYDDISGAVGWLKYLSKHASRGAKHYQRSGHPEGWNRTGRLWGHGGEWPTIQPMRYRMSMEAYHRYRRLVRAWRVADARQSGDLARLQFARRMLACSDPRLSSVRGISDWVPEDVTLRLIAMLEAEGHEVISEDSQ